MGEGGRVKATIWEATPWEPAGTKGLSLISAILGAYLLLGALRPQDCPISLALKSTGDFPLGSTSRA